MTRIEDIVDVDLFQEMINGGWINIQRHPTLPLKIYNYSRECAWERNWNEATLLARGLILDDDGVVVARPFSKFFNYEEHLVPELGLPKIDFQNQMYSVHDKVDGSLGILYPVGGGGYGIATRGSFTSDQAKRATEIWMDNGYAHALTFSEHWTLLFEIIYPENRIVLDYGDDSKLILLGAVNIQNGDTMDAWLAQEMCNWPDEIVESYNGANDIEELMSHDRPNKEGYVLSFWDTGLMVKVKHDTYKHIHSIITKANTKTVWAALRDDNLGDLMDLPDEFHAVLEPFIYKFRQHYSNLDMMGVMAWKRAAQIPTRKLQAAWITDNIRSKTVRSLAFAHLDGKSPDRIAGIIWKALEPDQAESLFAPDPDAD